MENHIATRLCRGSSQTPACHRVSLSHALREKHGFWSQTDLGSNPSYAIQQLWDPRQAPPPFLVDCYLGIPVSHASQCVCPHVAPPTLTLSLGMWLSLADEDINKHEIKQRLAKCLHAEACPLRTLHPGSQLPCLRTQS